MANYFLKEKKQFSENTEQKKEIHDVKQKVLTKRNVNL